MDYSFTNSRGLNIAADLLTPKQCGVFPTVIFSHGFDSGKRSLRSVLLAQDLLRVGVASLLIDFTGHGESGGTKSESTIEQQTDDLKSAIDFAYTLDQVDNSNIALHGSSSGCLVVLNLLLDGVKVKTAVLRAPRVNGYFSKVVENADKFNIPLYFIQGELDPLLEETKEFVNRLEVESELVIVSNADHLFTNPANLEEVVELSANWFANKLVKKKAA